jgi:hypothetical protein
MAALRYIFVHKTAGVATAALSPACNMLSEPAYVLSTKPIQGGACTTGVLFVLLSQALCLMFAWGSPAFMAASALYCLACRWPVPHGPAVVAAATFLPARN